MLLSSFESLESRTLFSAPTVTAASFDQQTRHALVFTFSADVGASLSTADLTLQNLTDRTTIDAGKIALSYNASTKTATFTFPGLASSRLSQANYQATLHADAITDGSSTRLAADAIVRYFVLPGDANTDRVVDLTDFTIFAANFNGTSKTFGQGDFNYDSKVDLTDFATLAAQYNHRLDPAGPAPNRFDVATWNATPDGSADHFGQAQLDALNAPGRGAMICMGFDTQRAQIVNNGNYLGAYYNTLNSPGYLLTTPDQKADQIEQYILDRFTANGLGPTYVVLNEVSSGVWPNTPDYRNWLKGVVYKLNVVYGREVILYSPFPTPGTANAADWQYLAKYSYIAAEVYISGAEMQSHGFSVSWAQSQYQASLTAYTQTVGIPKDRLILGEHFAQSVAGSGYGRDGVTYADWDSAIATRSTAAHNLNFNGYITYAWGKDGMLVPESEMIHFEQTYIAQTLP